jgi:hypothetical protein
VFEWRLGRARKRARFPWRHSPTMLRIGTTPSLGASLVPSVTHSARKQSGNAGSCSASGLPNDSVRHRGRTGRMVKGERTAGFRPRSSKTAIPLGPDRTVLGETPKTSKNCEGFGRCRRMRVGLRRMRDGKRHGRVERPDHPPAALTVAKLQARSSRRWPSIRSAFLAIARWRPCRCEVRSTARRSPVWRRPRRLHRPPRRPMHCECC